MERKSKIILLSLFLLGCSGTPTERKEVVLKEIKEFEYIEVKSVEVPKPFVYDVKKFIDSNGQSWALVHVNDLHLIKQAYVSAEQNAELVKQLNQINYLTVQRANLIRELVVLEAYRAEKMKISLEDERADFREQQIRANIESLTLKIITIMSLGLAL